jgi:hypothetical protein
MDSFGDYIYIIILVATVLGGLLKKSKKRDAKAEQKPLPEILTLPDEEEEYEDETGEILPGPVSVIPSAIPQMETITATEQTQWKPIQSQNTSNTSFAYIKNEMKSIFKEPEAATEKNIDDSAEFSQFELELESADDFRKAIIYSEIFTPKYKNL